MGTRRRRRAPRGWRWRLARFGVGLTGVALLGPVLLIWPLRFVQPVTTAMMLEQTWHRAQRDVTPWYPRRTTVDLGEISPSLARAVLAAEDDAFYLHSGFDVRQIKKAVRAKAAGGRLRGASTISQQTAKNLFLWSGRSFVRKGLEAYFTVYLEALLPKDRILEIYLNLVECADGYFGVQACCLHHFGRGAGALTPPEAARLAAILPNPRKWSPFGSYADRRVEGLLEVMQTPVIRP